MNVVKTYGMAMVMIFAGFAFYAHTARFVEEEIKESPFAKAMEDGTEEEIKASSAAREETFFDAVEADDVDRVAAFLEGGEVDVNVWRLGRKSPLCLAKSALMTHVLIHEGKAVVGVDNRNKFGQTPLFFVPNVSVLDELVSPLGRREDRVGNRALQEFVNVRDKNGTTALFHAADAAIAEKLIKLGADINAQDLSGKTALWTAVEYCAGAEVSKMTDEKAIVLAKEKELAKCFALVDVLLRAGADIEKQNKVGFAIVGDLLEPFLSESERAKLKNQVSQSHQRRFFVNRNSNTVARRLVHTLIIAGAKVPFRLMDIEKGMRQVILRAQSAKIRLQEEAELEAVSASGAKKNNLGGRRKILRFASDYAEARR